MITLVGISGSLRQQSYNSALLKAAADAAAEGIRIEIHSIADIPLYNGDVEKQQFPESVLALKTAIQQAQGLILATPEYNHGVPGVLKNTIDWLSRPNPKDVFFQLPVALMGASMGGFGTQVAQHEWQAVLKALKTRVWHEQDILVSRAQEKFSDNGQLNDPELTRQLTQFVSGFAEFCRTQGKRGA